MAGSVAVGAEGLAGVGVLVGAGAASLAAAPIVVERPDGAIDCVDVPHPASRAISTMGVANVNEPLNERMFPLLDTR